MSTRLVVMITQNDNELDEIFKFMSGCGDAVCKRLWTDPDLGSYDGGKEHPLVLFGHATTTAFIKDVKERNTVNRYMSGDAVVTQLKRCNLRATTFPFCFLVGCSSAGRTGNTGLFVNIANLLGIPTVGSTTDVVFSPPEGNCYRVTPESGGSWRVFFPDDGTYSLSTTRCDDIRNKLATFLFRAG